MFCAVQLWGCAVTQQTTAPSQDDAQAEAELAELFEGLAETEAPDAAVTAPTQQGQPVDALDQIAATVPQSPRLSPQGGGKLQVYDWRVINGAMTGNGFTGRTMQHFVRPVALAVQSDSLYVVDAGADTLFRFDLLSSRLEALLDLRAEVKGEVADIYVARDLSFYLTDTEAGRVLHYDRQGRLLQTFRNHFNMVRPVAVTVLDNGDVVVADAHYDHLLHFNSMGKLVATYGARGQGVAEFLNITAMARGPDGYYVGSRVGRRVQVVGTDGEYLYAFAEGAVVFPAAIVVDRNNRSYVADHMDNTIKVFDRGVLVGTIGGYGVATGRFKRITDLWLDGNMLYVIDGLNGRIQVARLAPAALPPSPAPEIDVQENEAKLPSAVADDPVTTEAPVILPVQE